MDQTAELEECDLNFSDIHYIISNNLINKEIDIEIESFFDYSRAIIIRSKRAFSKEEMIYFITNYLNIDKFEVEQSSDMYQKHLSGIIVKIINEKLK